MSFYIPAEALASDVGQAVIDYAVGATPVKGAGIISSIWALIRGQAEANSDTVAFNKGMEIAAVGDTLDLFNLYYVSSIKDEYGVEKEHDFSVYPSFKVTGRSQESTQKCVDNFNENFGEGGDFKGEGKDLGFDGSLTIEKLLDDFPIVVERVNSWKKAADLVDIDLNEATSIQE